MTSQKIDQERAKRLLDKLTRVLNIRQKSLEILVKVDKKTGEYKLKKMRKKLEDLTK